VATVQAAASQGGQHALAAELLLFVAIVGIRAVAQYGPGDKSKLPADQYGPLFILGNGFAAFFVLSFLAARGGTWAKVATAGGLAIDLALLMKSAAHLQVLAAEYDKPRKYTPISLAAFTPKFERAPLIAEVTTGQLPSTGPKGKSAAAAMGFAHRSLTAYGLKVSEFPLLVKLWNAESGWRWNATNPSSGAYGIPQSLPPNKMASVGADWRTNPGTQIKWGLKDIKDTYGSIAAAWAHEEHFGWY
jgi:hypothetical protein